jgi:hypothetical protein
MSRKPRSSWKIPCVAAAHVVEYAASDGVFHPVALLFMEGQQMSRVMTPPQAQPVSPPLARIPHEKVCMRAYEKWVKRGRPQGTDVQDWLEAENELRQEFNRNQGTPPPRR